MAGGALPVLAFSFLNVFMIMIPTYKRFMKFLKKSAEHEALPPDASEKVRRQSLATLQKVSSELTAFEEEDMVDHLLEVLELFEGREVERRQMVPPKQMRALLSSRSMRLIQSAPPRPMKLD